MLRPRWPFGVKQFLYLSLDGSVLDLLEEQFGLTDFLTVGDEIGGTELVPAHAVETEHLGELGRSEGDKRLEGDGYVGTDLERDVEDGGGA